MALVTAELLEDTIMRQRVKIDGLVQDNARLREALKHYEAALKHATECCSAFQSGGQFNHLMRPGEPIFNGVPRLVAQCSN